ncbi:hypothetical protein BCR32DRAFT_250453 [Anaeromyces robustus]|uniref:Uncharacterized protein n=1 Tax=Anaeromyces robustus TaxID=1754192 RepID=A0A1Y1W0G3_9FUNG|nr:hypothetical protein BCR32DRAFT_250453 [Anaeromyces robustus]|eukprot:ORX67007.1 hypothetical protein BCR32DRAFT_250453 [Anaeromyces robustus]
MIIENTGFVKCELVLLGELFFFFSLNYNPYNNYNDCAINIIFRHMGIILIYIVFILFISCGNEFGMTLTEVSILNDLPDLNSVITEDSVNEETIKISSKICSKIRDEYVKAQYSELGSSDSLSVASNKLPISDKISRNRHLNKKLNKSIEYIHSLCIEITLIFIIITTLNIMVVIKDSNNERKELQGFDGKWYYKCPLNEVDLPLNVVEFLGVIYLMIKAKKIWNFTFIFKCTKYIGYATSIWIFLGPLINLLSNFILKDRSRSTMFFNSIMNGICYLLILILFIWDKVYYILIKHGNNINDFFIGEKTDMCFLHKSYTCECIKNKSKESQEVLKKYIEFYKYCCQVIIVKNGRLQYISKSNKNSMKFLIE